MNYEEKYKEALERAKKFEEKYGGDYAWYIFPELAESEDERIRKRLIEYFEGFRMGNAEVKWEGLNVQEVLVWLEKQKEQKPAEWSELQSEFKNINEAFENGKKEVLTHPKKYGLCEQKPVDYDAELKKCKDNPLYFYDKYVSIKQKPTEWSEEDEKLFWGLTAYVPNEELERLGVTRNDILKKLKSIRHHPIQIKEAYKEGFQTARHATALAFMNYCDKIRPNGKMCLSNGECEEIEKAFLVGDWDKIERYFHKCHWKPSKEQMDILKSVKEYVGKVSGYWGDGLGSLIDDLEKLM